MNNTYTPTPEMEVVWKRFSNNEKPTKEELEALYNALKEKKAENAKLDVLKKADDPAYSRPKRYEGLDSYEEAEAFDILDGCDFSDDGFKIYGKGTIRQLRFICAFA